MSETQHATLVANTEAVITFTKNFGKVRVTQVANPALTYCNAKDTAIGSVVGDMTGNDVLPGVLCSLEMDDETGGVATKVRVRSVGTPTISVRAW